MNNDRQKIVPHLWFDDQAEEAASFYTSLFDDSRIGSAQRYGKEGFEIHGRPEGSVMSVEFQLAGFKVYGLNGGPHFTFTPAISFFVVCETESEIDDLWRSFSEGGQALMELGSYAWSEKYGWIRDRYGLTWQLSLGKIPDYRRRITPSFLFVNEQHDRAEDAVRFYTSVFRESEIRHIQKYGPEEPLPVGTVKHAQFSLLGTEFMVMAGGPGHPFGFNEAFSLFIHCDSQEEIDYYWEKLTEGGDPKAQQCGWLKDKYGVSWQVAPTRLFEMLRDPDKDRVARVTSAFLEMKKFDIRKLEKAYDGP